MIETRNRKMGPKAEKVVLQVSIDGVVISRFRSISEAGRQTGSDRRKISLCCAGKRAMHNGFRWIFEKDWAAK